MNSYADVTTFKSAEYANVSTNTEQVRFRKLLEQASRYLDKRCERWFYAKNETRYFDGAAGRIWLDDLLSVTTFKLDEDADGTFEETLTENSDYAFYPLNDYPKSWAEILTQGDYGAFASGVKRGVEIDALWGYGDGWSATPYTITSVTVTVATATGTTITVSADDVIASGHTILAGTEQMYVLSTGTGTFEAIRGVNGTTAAIQATATTYIYDYPMPIWEATLIIAMRAWKRKDSAFQDAVGSPETGLVITYKDEDPTVRQIIDRYRRRV